MLLVRAFRLPSLLLVLRSSQTGEELRLFKNVIRQSVRRRLTILRFCEFFVFTLPSLSSVFVARYCRYGFSVTSWFGCIFDVGRVNIFRVGRVFHSAHKTNKWSRNGPGAL